MGLVWVEVVVRYPDTGRHAAAKALVDTGAALTAVPRRIAEGLQLPVIGRGRVMTAKGTTELDECVGVVEVMGRKTYTHILVSDDIEIVLIGATALETLGLEVDPAAGKLKEAATYLL